MKKIKHFNLQDTDVKYPKKLLPYKAKGNNSTEHTIFIDSRLKDSFFIDNKDFLEQQNKDNQCSYVLVKQEGGMELFSVHYDVLFEHQRNKRLAALILKFRGLEFPKMMQEVRKEMDIDESMTIEDLPDTFLSSYDDRAIINDLMRLFKVVSQKQINDN